MEKFVMTPELKAQWIAALRSGKYGQAQGRLKDEEGFCCLGVLCDVIDNTKWGGYYGRSYNFGDGLSMAHSIPSIRLKTLNLAVPAEMPDGLESGRKNPDLEDAIMDLNDNHGWTFSQIADYIEENLIV